MNDKPNFASILDEAPTEIDRPKPIPTGTYLCRVQGTPTYDKSSKKGTPFVQFTLRTPDQLDEWMNDLRIHLERAEDYATRGYWPMNDTACDKFGGCKFRGVCSKSPSVREIYLESDFEQLPREEIWSPLRSR